MSIEQIISCSMDWIITTERTINEEPRKRQVNHLLKLVIGQNSSPHEHKSWGYGWYLAKMDKTLWWVLMTLVLLDERFVMLVYLLISCRVYVSWWLHCDGGQTSLGREKALTYTYDAICRVRPLDEFDCQGPSLFYLQCYLRPYCGLELGCTTH